MDEEQLDLIELKVLNVIVYYNKGLIIANTSKNLQLPTMQLHLKRISGWFLHSQFLPPGGIN